MSLLSRTGSLLGLTGASTLFGISTAAMALVAFAIASLLHFPNAFWAPMAVWIVAQPARGLLLERGVYRLLGTVAGALIGLLLLQGPLPAPLGLLLLAAWAGLCAALNHVTPTSLGYAAVMAGLTASVVLLPSLALQQDGAALALARVACTLIGVLCVILMGLVLLPAPPRRDLLDRLRGLTGDALRHLARPADNAQDDSRDGELLLAVVEAEQRLDPLHAGPLRRSRGASVSGAFVAGTLSLLAMARTLYRPGAPPPKALTDALEQAAAALDTPIATATASAALEQAAVQAETAHPQLARLLRRLAQAELAAQTWLAGGSPRVPLSRAGTLTTRRDWRSALIAGTSTAVVTLGAGLAVLYSGWANAWIPAMGLCTFTMVLSGMDLPQQLAPRMAQGILVGVALAAVFRLLLLPHAEALLDILWMLAPFMLFGGLARASTRTSVPALNGNMCFMLASQPFLSASTAPLDVLIDCGALVASIALVALAYRLLPRDPGRRAAHLAELILRDLERLCGQPGHRPLGQAWYGRMYRRLLRLMLHVGRAERLGLAERAGMLGALTLAEAIVELRRQLAETALDAARRRLLEQALDALRHLSRDPDATARKLEACLAAWEALEGQTCAADHALHQARQALANAEGLWKLRRPHRRAATLHR